jgi:hypothetical protein
MKIKEVGRYFVYGCLGGIYIIGASIGTMMFASGLAFWFVADSIEKKYSKERQEDSDKKSTYEI